MKVLKRINLIDVIVFLFVTLFVYAAVSKVIEFDMFKAQIGKSPLIMHHVEWIAWLVPGAEIVISLALLVPRFQMNGFYGAFLLMLMFTLYIAFILTFSPYVPCSCGGILENMGWGAHLVFNICFTLLAIVGVVLLNRNKRVSLGLVTGF